ncbi:uncharacterized protein [Trachinotus anak]|uniref:uncharacterized protein n=1 Tax=Trachinotus anak TaxID=443729 RepID=UPI0039F1BBB6
MITLFNKSKHSSEKYKDIISKSTLIHSGSPALYQLRPEKEQVGNLTRMTIGKKNPNKINKTILLVGEIGTGKSTLVNALLNYTMGVKCEDNIWFMMEEEKEKEGQSESRTSDVIVYEIFGFEDKTLSYSLTIIDTPGYGSTKGIEHDDIVSKELLELFSSDHGLHEINAVGLVLRATECRLSDRLKYIFDSVVSLFGKDIENKIVALITHSTGGTPTNVLQALEAANIKCAKNEKQQAVHFLFDNCQKTQKSEETSTELVNAWRVTKKGMSQFTAFLERSSPQKLKTTVKVLKTRVRLAACIQNLQERIMLIELKQTEIQQTREGLKKHEEEMRKNEGFTVEVDEVYKDKETIAGGRWGLFFFEGAVVCTVCQENCHYPGCTVAWSPEGCEVIKRGHCIVCTNKCPASDHVKETWRFVNKTRKVQRTATEMKEEFEKNKAESERKSSLLENLEKEMKDLTAQMNQLVEEAYEHVVRLDEIALNVNSLSTHVHLDSLIEKLEKKGDTEKVQKLDKMRSRVDEGTKAGLRYMFGKVTAGW